MEKLVIKDRTGATLYKNDIVVIIPDPHYEKRDIKAIIRSATETSTKRYTISFLPLDTPYLNELKEDNGDNPDYFMNERKLIGASKLQLIKVKINTLDPWERTIYNQMVPLL